MNKILVLDVGGVLATNLTPSLWEQLALMADGDHHTLYAAYKAELSQKLWTGQCTEEQWRLWLANRGIALELEQSNELIAKHLRPLPAMNKLEQWAKMCNIIIMSNHRSEWLLPVLQPYTSYFTDIHISNIAGRCKPDPQWFQAIDESFSRPCQILFVDDSNKNINAAQLCGWKTVLADEEGNWTKSIDEWLHSTASTLASQQ